jgi:RNA polymerase sigma-70 factor (ECF subfamily)
MTNDSIAQKPRRKAAKDSSAKKPMKTTVASDPNRNFSAHEFLEKLRHQDHEAIETLVRTYTTHLHRAALGMRFDENGAQELVQNTWNTFFERVPTFEGRSHIRTYLFGILYNKANEARRDKKKADAHDPIEDVMESKFDERSHWLKPQASPDKALQSAETLVLIEECMEDLNENQRSAFYLREVENLSTEEICKILKVTVTNLGVILYRARNRLRECLTAKSAAL